MKIGFYYCLSLLMLIIGCKSDVRFNDVDYAITDTLRLADFPIIHTENKKISEVPLVISTMSVTDSFLLYSTLRNNLVVEIMRLSDEKVFGSYLKRGSGNNEYLGVAGIVPTDSMNSVWLFDITLGKIGKLNLAHLISRSQTEVSQNIILRDSSKRAKSVYPVHDNLFVANSYLFSSCRYVYFDSTSKILRKVGKMPTMQKGWPNDVKEAKFSTRARVFTASLIKHPSENIIAEAYYFTDRIELYRSDSLFKIIRGPELFEPTVSFRNEGTNMQQVIENEKTKVAYQNVYATDRALFALYSGKVQQDDNDSSTLLIINWTGKPLGRVSLPGKCAAFAVSAQKDGFIIYWSEYTSGSLMKSSITF